MGWATPNMDHWILKGVTFSWVAGRGSSLVQLVSFWFSACQPSGGTILLQIPIGWYTQAAPSTLPAF